MNSPPLHPQAATPKTPGRVLADAKGHGRHPPGAGYRPSGQAGTRQVDGSYGLAKVPLGQAQPPRPSEIRGAAHTKVALVPSQARPAGQAP